MKNLTLIVHTDTQQLIADVLRAMPRIKEFMFTHVEGHGAHSEQDRLLSARDRVVGYTPHVRVDILLNDPDVDSVLDTLRQPGPCCLTGRGLYWITAAERAGRL